AEHATLPAHHMAIGLGYIFGLKLPLNFNSPFKATSISDFWRRWHMTMTRFFTTYLFTPMAISGTRAAAQRGYGRWRRWAAASMVPVVVTFLLAGVWHGAGWTFVVFGLLHGGALAVNHGWRTFNGPDLGPVLGWLLTMSVVVTGLVIFRAPDLETAGVILQSMWAFGPLLDIAIAFATDGSLAAALADPAPVAAAESVRLDAPVALVFVLVYGAIVLGLPNTQEVLRDHWVSSDPEPEDAPEDDRPTILRWRPTPAWSVAAGALLVLAVASIGDQSGFLYYQF
ncbi:MAG: MBOAT family O-acyltransferase, partial [Pseudomonadota bacterium]